MTWSIFSWRTTEDTSSHISDIYYLPCETFHRLLLLLIWMACDPLGMGESSRSGSPWNHKINTMHKG